MFIGAAVFQFVGAVCYLSLDLPSSVKEGEDMWSWIKSFSLKGGGQTAPSGARLCDRLMFLKQR
jgi:hypothetical protein